MSQSINIVLDAGDFLTLVSGEVYATVRGGQEVRIILSDIGYGKMLASIEDAIRIQRDRALARDDPRSRIFPP